MKWAIFTLIGAVAALWAFGPYEPLELEADFDPRTFGEGVQVYLESTEARFDDIKPGSEKRVIWAKGYEEQRAPLSIVYFHGFSANAQEIRPVPDRVAERLGANLVFTRFTGHGRSNDAMAEASVGAWMQDVAEALALGRETGERVIVISTSTGSTLAALAALRTEWMDDVAGIVFVSPNFGINNAMAPLLTWPAARHWLPLLAGHRRSFEPSNDAQAREWTTEYPSVAVFPMAALVKHAAAQDYAKATVPALFYYSNKDSVVDPEATAKVQAAWGGPVQHISPNEAGLVDRYFHVIAGDILSPTNTDEAVQVILDWLGRLS